MGSLDGSIFEDCKVADVEELWGTVFFGSSLWASVSNVLMSTNVSIILLNSKAAISYFFFSFVLSSFEEIYFSFL